MSQAKVDRYKEQKANRKEIMKKEKRMRTLRNSVITLVIVALLGWISFSVYQMMTSPSEQQKQAVEVDYSSINEYLNGLSVEE